ncbi:MAG: ABC transporter permease [Vicinamibacterales bacterium]
MAPPPADRAGGRPFEEPMEALLQDLRHTVRVMAGQKAFTVAVLLTLALGIGATTAIFSVVHGVLLRPLPYPAADRLVRLGEHRPGMPPIPDLILLNYTYYAWQEEPRTLDGLGAWGNRSFTLVGGQAPERVRGATVTPGLFEMLGVSPQVGRFMTAADAAEGAAPVVVLSYRFWQERFGADPAAVGQVLRMDDRAVTVIGVARPDFYFPDREARLWTPFRPAPPSSNPNEVRVEAMAALGRLAPGATPQQVAAEGQAAMANAGLPPALGRGPGGPGGPETAAPPMTMQVEPLVDALTARVRPALLLLAGGVAFVLLIGCANVANLFLSRSVSRERELAVRAAMGAGRRRLLAQLIVESLGVALTGGALGLALGWALTRVLPSFAPADFPRLEDVRVDGTVLLFALVASVAAGLLSGVMPAIKASRVDLVPALREGSGASAGSRLARLRAGLLVLESALAVMLLVGAALLARSFVSLVNVDPGYDPDNVLTATVYLPSAGHGPAPESAAFAREVLERLRALPGVEAAGASNMTPLGGAMMVQAAELPGPPGPDGQPVIARAVAYTVTPGYAEALGLRVREGRVFADADLASGIQPLMINDAFAAAYLADGRPIVGRRLEGFLAPGVTSEIVCVVGDVRLRGLDAETQPEMYTLAGPAAPFRGPVSLVIKTAGDPRTVVPALREATAKVNAAAAVDAVLPLAARVSASVSQPRFAATLLAAFAALALVLAAVGLYGVMSYTVTRRQREIGVRSALGATRGDLVRLVMGQGLAVTVAGLLLGMAGAAALTRLLGNLLFGVTPLDPVAFVAAPVLLLSVAAAACLVPARRAAAVDPVDALRCE